MTTAADDAAVEDAFEAFLAGRPVSGPTVDTFPGLAAFSESVRATATQPGRPNAALAELLVTGLLTDQSSPSARTATSAGSPPARRSTRVRIRRRTAMIFPVLLAKFLSAGAIAQAATGAGVAIVVVAGVGAAGALPDPLQNTVSSVVETVTPFEVPSGDEPVEEPAGEDDLAEEPTGDDVVAEATVEDAAFDPEAWVEAGPTEGESFGTWVSASARNPELREWLRAEGRTFGSVVRDWAHKKGLDDQDLVEEGIDPENLDDATEETTTEPVEEDTEVEPAPEVETATADDDSTTAKHSNGNGNGNGKGAGNGKGRGHN